MLFIKLRPREIVDEAFLMQNLECRMQNFGVPYGNGYIEVFMSDNIIVDKSFQFAIRIVNLYRHITTEKKEFVLSKQLLRCGTSIGANVAEGQRAQSNADFYAKMSIALKEANETDYWLRLLYKTEYLTEKEFESIYSDIDEIIAILTSICKASQT